MAHLLLARHTVCAEHGEVVEVTTHDQEQPSVSTELAVGAATFDLTHPTADGHEDHCGWLSDRRDHRPMVATLPAPTTSSFVDQLAPAHIVSTATRALYRLAPKVSPPLSA